MTNSSKAIAINSQDITLQDNQNTKGNEPFIAEQIQYSFAHLPLLERFVASTLAKDDHQRYFDYLSRKDEWAQRERDKKVYPSRDLQMNK